MADETAVLDVETEEDEEHSFRVPQTALKCISSLETLEEDITKYEEKAVDFGNRALKAKARKTAVEKRLASFGDDAKDDMRADLVSRRAALDELAAKYGL